MVQRIKSNNLGVDKIVKQVESMPPFLSWLPLVTNGRLIAYLRDETVNSHLIQELSRIRTGHDDLSDVQAIIVVEMSRDLLNWRLGDVQTVHDKPYRLVYRKEIGQSRLALRCEISDDDIKVLGWILSDYNDKDAIMLMIMA